MRPKGEQPRTQPARPGRAAPEAEGAESTAGAEWRAFREVLREAVECAIDHAVVGVADFFEEVRALEHLREVVRARFAGQAAPMRITELLHGLGIVLGAFQPRGESASVGVETKQDLATAAARLQHLARVATDELRAVGDRALHSLSASLPFDPRASAPNLHAA